MRVQQVRFGLARRVEGPPPPRGRRALTFQPTCTAGRRTLARSACSNDSQQVMIATANGNFYQYYLDTKLGGECALLRQFRCAGGARRGQRALEL